MAFSTSDFRGGHWWRKLQDFTNNLLMLNNARCLDAFRLDLFWATEFPDLCRDTERWVRRGIKCQPPVFQIRVYRDIFRYHFQIPRLGSGFHRLKSLELVGVFGPLLLGAAQFWMPSPGRFAPPQLCQQLCCHSIRHAQELGSSCLYKSGCRYIGRQGSLSSFHVPGL